MLFRQLFDRESCTYTYLIASRPGGEALIIDAVLERVDQYLRLLGELELKLVKAVDTHVHADHVTAMGALRDRTGCLTVMGARAGTDVLGRRLEDGEKLRIEGVSLEVLHTPGHTDDSYCFALDDRVLTGDTLLIRGTGRTDFQNGDPYAQYDSLFNKLLRLPDHTLVYPGHDYKGEQVSTIGEERAHNPRLQVDSADQYAELMNGLNLDYPKKIDVAVPANLSIGLDQAGWVGEGRSVAPAEAGELLAAGEAMAVDLREHDERERHGEISGSLHAPYPDLDEYLAPGGMLRELARASGKAMLLYCGYGECSAMAARAALELGLGSVRHLRGGLASWRDHGGAVHPP